MEQEEIHSTEDQKTFSVKTWIDANWDPIVQQVTEDELLNGYLRQSDYTRKTQELAEERKMIWGQQQVAPATDDDAAVEQYLASKGYAKQETVESIVEAKLKWITKAQQDEQTIQSIISSNPDLKQFEWAIRKIAATDNSAIEDIVVKYGFSNHDKLSKAKTRDIKGWSNKLESDQPKPVSEWTKEDWATFEKTANKSQFR